MMALRIIGSVLGRAWSEIKSMRGEIWGAIKDIVGGVVSLVVGAGLVFGTYKILAVLGRFSFWILDDTDKSKLPELGQAFFGLVFLFLTSFGAIVVGVICWALGMTVREKLSSAGKDVQIFVARERERVVVADRQAATPEAGAVSMTSELAGAVSFGEKKV